MAKAKNIYAPLVVTGSILFGLLVIAVIVSTAIPFGMILLQPQSIKLNVAITAVALTAGAILPALVGYFIGDASVKSKSRLQHHFNGVLFGLLSYWMMQFFGLYVTIPALRIDDHNVAMIVANTIPAAAVAILTTVIAVLHVRGKAASKDMPDYRPFQILLIVGALAIPVVSLVGSLVVRELNLYSVIPLAAVLILGCVSYATLRHAKLSKATRVSWSAISVSVLFVSVFVAVMLGSALSNYFLPYPTMTSQTLSSLTAFAVAIAGWLTYWVAQRKRLVSIKRPR